MIGHTDMQAFFCAFYEKLNSKKTQLFEKTQLEILEKLNIPRFKNFNFPNWLQNRLQKLAEMLKFTALEWLRPRKKRISGLNLQTQLQIRKTQLKF